MTISSETDARVEAAWMARVAVGAAGVVDLAAVAKKTLGDAFGRREGEVHALIHALVKAGRLVPAGHSLSGATLYGAAGAAQASSEPVLDAPPPSSKAASRKALSIASGVRDPEDRGRVVSDILAHLTAIAAARGAAGGTRSFGSTSRTRALLHRVDRGRRTISMVATPGEALKRFAIHEGPGLLVALIAFVSVWLFLVEPRVVPSRSMQPTLQPGDRIVVWKPAGGEEPKRWSIITFRRDDDVVLVKRVVGLPGESIKIDDDGDALVDGVRLVKPDDVREAVREPLLRTEFSGGIPDGWLMHDVGFLTRTLWADEPRAADEPPLVGGRPQVHDLYVEARFALDGDRRPEIVRLSWEPRDPTAAGERASDLLLQVGSDGRGEVLAQNRSRSLASFDAAAALGADADPRLRLAYVDGRVHASVGSWSWTAPLAVLPGAVQVGIGGKVRTVAIDRDVHYTKQGRYATENAFAIPAGHVFCLGDHSYNSTDSRYERPGPVPISRILGRVIFRIWPPWRVGPIH